MLDDKSSFDSSEKNFLFEEQLVVLMNTIPCKDTRQASQFFSDEYFDFLAPLEILNSNSLCDYALNKTNFIKN